MKVKELIKFLKRFSKADFLIDGQDVHFEIYEDQSGRMVVNLKLPEKNEKSLDEAKKLAEEKKKQEVEDSIENHLEPIYQELEDLRRYIRETKDIEKLAASIVDTLNVEYYIKATVGIGTQVTNIKDLANSFKEAQIAPETKITVPSDLTAYA